MGVRANFSRTLRPMTVWPQEQRISLERNAAWRCCTMACSGGWSADATPLSEIGLRTPGVNPGVKARSRRLQVFIRRFCYHVGMKIKLSAHGAYHPQYHVVWIPKYRTKALKGELKQSLEKGLCDIERFHPDI